MQSSVGVGVIVFGLRGRYTNSSVIRARGRLKCLQCLRVMASQSVSTATSRAASAARSFSEHRDALCNSCRNYRASYDEQSL